MTQSTTLPSPTPNATSSIPTLNFHPNTLTSKTNEGRLKQSPPFGTLKDLPIRGRAQGGDEGNLSLEENPIDWTYRPADLQGVHGAFAVFVTGDSMIPKYKDQDLAYIHPSKKPRRNRFVLVETMDHHGFIKQFNRWDKDTLILKQFNPEKEIHIARADVRKVMMVIGSLDA